VLWHLGREVELAHLAQRAVALDRLSPHAWCAVGNCFSLHKVRRRRGGARPVVVVVDAMPACGLAARCVCTAEQRQSLRDSSLRCPAAVAYGSRPTV
jgi:hypothetical protein